MLNRIIVPRPKLFINRNPEKTEAPSTSREKSRFSKTRSTFLRIRFSFHTDTVYTDHSGPVSTPTNQDEVNWLGSQHWQGGEETGFQRLGSPSATTGDLEDPVPTPLLPLCFCPQALRPQQGDKVGAAASVASKSLGLSFTLSTTLVRS